jgi:predicted Zn-dependent protease
LLEHLLYSSATLTGRTPPKVRPEQAEGLLGGLSLYRRLLVSLRSKAVSKKLLARIASETSGTLFVRLAAYSLAQRWSWQGSGFAADAWLTAAEALRGSEPELAAGAMASAARVYASRGKYPAAASIYQRLYREFPGAPAPDAWVRNAMTGAGGGQAAFELLWGRWRRAAMKRGEVEDWIAVVQAAAALGRPQDADRAVVALVRKEYDSVALAERAVAVVWGAGRGDEALGLARRVRDSGIRSASLLGLLSSILESRGRLGEAADALEEAAESDPDARRSLADLRTDYHRLVDLNLRAAQGEGSEGLERRVDRALDFAREWREIDPVNPEREKNIARRLYALGKDDFAWRTLSTILDMQPGQGKSHAAVAEVLQGEGRLAAAEVEWRRAVALDAEDPTWSLRLAQLMALRGQKDQAIEILKSLEKGRWNDRFSQILREARSLRTSLQQ